MAFIENFLTPLTQAVIFVAVFILLLVGLYFLIMKLIGKKIFKIRMWIKYKLMKRAYDERVILWAIDMINRKVASEMLMREFYITNVFPLGMFEEGMFIYYQIKQMQKLKQ